jgi:hypothetical protein
MEPAACTAVIVAMLSCSGDADAGARRRLAAAQTVERAAPLAGAGDGNGNGGGGETRAPAGRARYYGLLRARDLTFFSLPHLDMRPAHAVAVGPGGWGLEAQAGYQNTWSLSREVERYLVGLPGRRELGPQELAAILALPGENYLIDAEIGLLDVTAHYKLSGHWGVYAIASAVSFSGGVGDGTIERFHDRFGFSSFGRKALSRSRVNVVLDLRDAQRVSLGSPTRGGMLDPTIGLRYSGLRLPERWNLVLEAAVKLPVNGRREFLSTGDAEPGLQATLQYFGDRHALYAAVSAVRYGADDILPGNSRRTVPTAVLGVEYRWSERTHWLLQAYASRPWRSRRETDLTDLTRTKYQASLGVYRAFGSTLLSFAVTENLQNHNNTPDIGLQLGLAWVPTLRD